MFYIRRWANDSNRNEHDIFKRPEPLCSSLCSCDQHNGTPFIYWKRVFYDSIIQAGGYSDSNAVSIAIASITLYICIHCANMCSYAGRISVKIYGETRKGSVLIRNFLIIWTPAPAYFVVYWMECIGTLSSFRCIIHSVTITHAVSAMPVFFVRSFASSM